MSTRTDAFNEAIKAVLQLRSTAIKLGRTGDYLLALNTALDKLEDVRDSKPLFGSGESATR